ncbi:MAG TPA: glycosyltransferase family 1 protein [Gemmataceae bacterium]|nr:glycosyltransferase family 1 protein [Gemmataceae bacterium]
MHLLIDGQALQTPSSRLRGIGRYGSNLLRALPIARPNWRIEVVQNSSLPPIAREDLAELPVLSFTPPLAPAVPHQDINERFYADWLTARGPDGVLVLSPCEGWEALVPCFCGSRPRLFGIAYDLIPLLYPRHYLNNIAVSRWYAHRFRQLLSSDALLAISEATARDVRVLGGADAPLVVNIAGAVDPLFAPLSPSEQAAGAALVRKRFNLDREFILHIGALDHRKNLLGAIRAFAALPAKCRAALDLAVVCRLKPAEKAAVEEMARASGVSSSVKLICSANDQDLRTLYATCRLFFFPSLYEGLGLPVLEALHCGAPVVTSDCSSLPEYAGPVSWLGDPTSPEAMAVVLREALAEPRDARRPDREAFARTFHWNTTAERACAVMERSLSRFVKPLRRRLAWVMPMTAADQPMLEYAAKLLPLLSEHFDIELIAGYGSIAALESLSQNHLLLSAQEVAARHAAKPYDMFIYQWSASPRHRFMLDLLPLFPGLIELHDFSTVDLDRLVELNLLRPRSASGEWVPGLGLLVHSAAAWQQAGRVVNSSILCLSLPSSLLAQSTATKATQPHDFRHLAAGYVRWIDRAIDQHEQTDGPWHSFALQCLADHPDMADRAIDTWTTLRTQGQQQLAG